MTPQHIKTIQATWQEVTKVGDTATDLFYFRLFQLDPTLRRMFEAVDMEAQKTKLVETLSVVVCGLSDPRSLLTPLAELGRRHAGYGVTEGHYETVGAALLWTLERGLGAYWSEDVRHAWSAAYQLIAGEMINGAANASNECREQVA